MKANNVIRIIVGAIFALSAFYLFSKREYIFGILLLFALLILLKIDDLTDFAFSFKGGIRAKFNTPKEKIEQNIIENKQSVTRRNILRFQKIEAQILDKQQKKYGKEVKTLIHFVYGKPDKPEFSYTPDGSLQTDDTLYFFEIKYILKPELAKNIVYDTVQYLKIVYDKFSSYMGKDKKLIIKILLASEFYIDITGFSTPAGIELEFIKT